MFKKYSLNKLLVLVTTIGFAFLLADTTIEHWSTFEEEIMVFIPFVFSIIGVVLGIIVVITWKEKLIRWFQILLFASFIVAAAGLYFHIVEEEDEINLTSEEREHEENEKDKPLLAPLAFAGLAVIGLLGTMRKWEAEIKKS
jgi:uncharacterized membrane protein YfcA